MVGNQNEIPFYYNYNLVILTALTKTQGFNTIINLESEKIHSMFKFFVVEVENWRVIHLTKSKSAIIHCEEILFNFNKNKIIK